MVLTNSYTYNHLKTQLHYDTKTMEKAGSFPQAHHLDVPAQLCMQAVPGNTGSWGVLEKALEGEQVLQASMREY